MTPAPKRRWFHWSLRTPFVVVTVFVCWLGWGSWEMHQRALLLGRIVESPYAIQITDATGVVVGIDLRGDIFSEQDFKRAEAMFPGLTVMRTPKYYWNYHDRDTKRFPWVSL